MSTRIKADTNWKQIATLYIGTVIGAGFASGQEILQFFVDYGYKGIIGALVSTILFIVVATGVLIKVYNNKLGSYQELIVPVLGKKLSVLAEFVMLSYLFIGACIMVSGSGALFEEQLGLNYNMGLILMAILTFVTVIRNVEGVLKVNGFLIPILLFGIVAIGLVVFFNNGFDIPDVTPVQTNTHSWLTSSVMYVNYNVISAIVVLASLLSVIDSKKTAIKGGVMGGLGLGVLAMFLIIPLLILYGDVHDLEIPMLAVAKSVIPNGDIPYSFLIWIAMFTTAVSNTFGFLTRLCDIININFKILAFVFCALTIPVAKMGFSNLVDVFYPIFGYLGSALIALFIIISIYKEVKKWIEKKIIERKTIK